MMSRIFIVFCMLLALAAGAVGERDYFSDHSASGGIFLWKGVFDGVRAIRQRDAYPLAGDIAWQGQQKNSLLAFIRSWSALNDRADDLERNTRSYAIDGVERAMGNTVAIQSGAGQPDEHSEFKGLVSAWDPVYSSVVTTLMAEHGGVEAISIKELTAMLWAEAERIDRAEPDTRKKQQARESVVNALITAQRRYNIDNDATGADQPSCVEGTFTIIGSSLNGISPDFHIKNVSIQERLVDRYKELIAEYFVSQPLDLMKHLIDPGTDYDDERYAAYERECSQFVQDTMRKEFSEKELQEGQFQRLVVDAMEPGNFGCVPQDSIATRLIQKKEGGKPFSSPPSDEALGSSSMDVSTPKPMTPHGRRFAATDSPQHPAAKSTSGCQAYGHGSAETLLAVFALALLRLSSRRKRDA